MSRTYIRIHDHAPEHPKIEKLSNGAFRLWIECLCWCSKFHTDGKIPSTTWRKRGTSRLRTELRQVGLVELTDDGVIMHDYLDWQRSADQAKALQRQAIEAGKISALRRAQRQQAVNAPLNDPLNGALNAESTPPLIYTETKRERTKNKQHATRVAASDARRPDVEKLCNHLADAIVANGSKRPRITEAWRAATVRMLDRDGLTVEQIMRAIDWCQADEFWRIHILSMSKLRAKYDQLRLAAKRSTGTRRPAPVGAAVLAPEDPRCERHPHELAGEFCRICPGEA